ncbi:hypothetical protein KM043_014926 [Ampulex compressa]|nr:hypothetical protein KM043_014926 [Ampulex compressa]
MQKPKNREIPKEIPFSCGSKCASDFSRGHLAGSGHGTSRVHHCREGVQLPGRRLGNRKVFRGNSVERESEATAACARGRDEGRRGGRRSEGDGSMEKERALKGDGGMGGEGSSWKRGRTETEG